MGDSQLRIDDLNKFVFTNQQPSGNTAYDLGKFVGYLGLGAGPGFYDGELSTVKESDAQCGVSSLLSNKTVQRDFQEANGLSTCDQAAISCRLDSKQPQRTFFEPRAIIIASQGPIDANIALEFHEALHGFTGMLDPALQTFLGCSKLNNTSNITLYLQQFVGAQPLQGKPVPCSVIENHLPTNQCVR